MTSELVLSPLAVRLSAGELDDTVVEPDLFVVSDLLKFDVYGCVGSPDLVIVSFS
jgi:hypothetical protein